MTRREFALAAAAAPMPANRARVLLTEAEIAALRPPAALASQREAARQAGPWSVTFHRPQGLQTKAGRHDFFSEGPYWWPDPKNPEGPYIRRDGEVNPARFTRNDADFGRLCDTVLLLALDATLHREAASAERAWQLIRVWFLNPETRMNPDLEFGQAIRGRVDGRGIGIIDTRGLIWCVQGVALLRTGAAPGDAARGFDEWLGAYTDWLTTSPKGKDEQHHGNNHSTWWAAQTLAFAMHLGRGDLQRKVLDLVREELIPRQLRPDGSAPEEEARTKSLSYTMMNLDGFALLCRMAKRRGTDLWNFQTAEGSGVRRSIEYVAPFAADPSRWRKPQIAPVGQKRGYFLGLAGLDLGKPEWIALQRSFGAAGGAWGLLLESMLDAG